MSKKDNKQPVAPVSQEVNKDVEAVQSVQLFISKMQSSGNLVTEAKKSVDEALQLGDMMLKKIMPLMNEKNMKIKELEEKVKTLEAIAGTALKEEKKGK